MEDVIFQAFVVALIGVIAFILKQLSAVGIEYLKSKIGESQFNQLMDKAGVVVMNLAQNPVFAELDKSRLKEIAVQNISTWREDNKLPFTAETIDAAIEAAVKAMKE